MTNAFRDFEIDCYEPARIGDTVEIKPHGLPIRRVIVTGLGEKNDAPLIDYDGGWAYFDQIVRIVKRAD